MRLLSLPTVGYVARISVFLSLSRRAFDLRQLQIWVMLNDLFDPLQVAPIFAKYRLYYERISERNVREFGIFGHCVQLVDIRILIPDWHFRFIRQVNGQYSYGQYSDVNY